MAIMIDTKLNEFPLPVHIQSDCDYYSTLENILNNYYRHICKIENIEGNTRYTVAANIQIIKKSIQYYFNGNISEAQILIKSILKKYLSEPYFVSKFDKSYAFRGMAVLEDRQKKYGYDKIYKDHYKKMNEFPISLFRGRVSDKNLCKEDMLHIPFDSREKVSTQRYSISGIPCLYFSTTTLGCYLELGKPQFESLYLSSYKVDNNSAKLLNFCIFQHTINGVAAGYIEDYEMPQLLNLIEIFPLVIASSFVVDDKKTRNFKTEYLVPQLIMMSINEMGIDAIAYLSTHMKDFYAYPHCVNIAIPMKANSPYNKYSEMLKYFSVTEPICINKCLSGCYESNTKSYINEIYNTSGFTSKIVLDNREYIYADTKFASVDNILVSQPYCRIVTD